MRPTVILLALISFFPALRAEATAEVVVGQSAPVFEGVTVDGAHFSLAAVRGRVVLLAFFVTSRGPCLQMLDRLEKEIWGKYPGLEIITVGRGHSAEELGNYKREKQFSFPMIPDPKHDIFNRYASSDVPRCYLIGPDGRVTLQLRGYEYWPFEHLKEQIAAALQQAAAAKI